MFSYNTTVHSSTQFTPHRLVFGEEARIPSEFESGEVSITYNEYLYNLLFKIFEAQSTAHENIEQAKIRYKYYYDQKLKVENYEIGEHVYLQKEPRTSKLDDHYEGPYKITNVFNDNNIEIAISESKRKIAHKNKLKRPFTSKSRNARGIKTCYDQTLYKIFFFFIKEGRENMEY